MIPLKATAYDSEGNEIVVPEGFDMILGKDAYCFVRNEGNVATFVYKSHSGAPLAMDAKILSSQ